MNKAKGYKLSIFVFLLPALLLFIGVLIAPIIMSTYYSFFNWKVGYPLTDFMFKGFSILYSEDVIFYKKYGTDY